MFIESTSEDMLKIPTICIELQINRLSKNEKGQLNGR
jgi:hypothetical protein